MNCISTSVSVEIQFVVNDRRQFFFIVSDHDERLVPPFAEGFNNIFHQTAVAHVQTMQRFIKNQQFRVFDKSSRYQYQPLFATGKLQEITVLPIGNAENIHPFFTTRLVFFMRLARPIESCSPLAIISITGRFFW